jgi:hypothetical protein
MFKHIRSEERTLSSGAKTQVKVWENQQTGSQLTTSLLRTDEQGNKWWQFDDLLAIPFIRQMAAKQTADLYGHGLALADIKGYTGELKVLLRSTDEEKYDKAMAKVLEMENLADRVADPVKQCLGLTTVYLLLNDERPDVYMAGEQAVKMSIMAVNVDLQAFFLNWWTDVMVSFGKLFNGVSAIASLPIK